MTKELLSPLVVNTLGGLLAILLIIFVLDRVNVLIRSVKNVTPPPANGNGGKDGFASDIFSRSVPFNLHVAETKAITEATCALGTKIEAFGKGLSDLISYAERQTVALEELVKLRRVYTRKKSR
jgi:hypothetical protein